MKDVTNKPKRPFLITLFSVFAIYAGLMFFYQVFRAVITNFDITNAIRFTIGGIVFFSVGIGLWSMKKWAVHLYAFFAIVNLIFQVLLAGKLDIMSLVIPGIVIIVGYTQFSRMS